MGWNYSQSAVIIPPRDIHVLVHLIQPSGRSDRFHTTSQGRLSPSWRSLAMHLVDARVLVVEDDDASREMLRATLADAGFSVRVAAHGTDALLVLHREIPHLVVLGLVLPLVNGIEVLRAMRRLPHMGDVPVLVVTGSATTAHDLRSFAPVHVMRKPLELETVIATVHTFVKPRQGARSG